MLDALSKRFFHALAASGAVKRMASTYGMRSENSFARRFIAGETIEEAVPAARQLQSQHMSLTLDLLGESVASVSEAAKATRDYQHVMDVIAEAGVERNISLKLTQLGLDIDRATSVDNLRRTLDTARQAGFFVRIDMENSPYTDATLDIFETVWQLGYRNVGVVLQSCLRRSEDDLRRVNALAARVRVVKGAYKEPPTVAYQTKSEVDAAFLRMMQVVLAEGTFPAIATHDPKMIEETKAFASRHGITPDRFEFQMLFGVRRDLQAALVKEGYGMRIYVPFGHEWFPYFMRRLGERPANVLFVLRGVLSERRGS